MTASSWRKCLLARIAPHRLASDASSVMTPIRSDEASTASNIARNIDKGGHAASLHRIAGREARYSVDQATILSREDVHRLAEPNERQSFPIDRCTILFSSTHYPASENHR